MILLDSGHPMIKETIIQRITGDKHGLMMHISDFDDVSYQVQAKDMDNLMTISFSMPGFQDVLARGLQDYLSSVYGKDEVKFSFDPVTINDAVYSMSITFDVSAPREEGGVPFAERVSCLKRNVLAAPFFWYFAAIKAGSAPAEPLKIPFRRDESIYIKKGNEDQCVVIFSVKFHDKNDWVIAEVFLREFTDARRDSALQQAPVATFSRTPPGELTGVKDVEKGDNVCFISFTLFKRHWDGNPDASVSALCQFRNYLHYHIKMRMRKRVDDLLHVLNRAKPAPEGTVEKKTWSGRSVAK